MTATDRSLAAILAALTAPFPSHLVVLKPGAIARTRDRALALPYADTRAYQERLDQVVGPDHWQAQIELSAAGAVCALTILGVTKADVGDYPPDEEGRPAANRATSAAAQAFKRACAAFSLGRYLYALPRTWADYDDAARGFVNPQRVVIELYTAAGLADQITDRSLQAARAAGASPSTPPVTPPMRQSADRGAPPASTPGSGPAPATDAQLGLIARLLGQLQAGDDEEAEAAAGAIDAIGDRLALAGLSAHTSRERLRALGLTKASASTLIERLKGLQEEVAAASAGYPNTNRSATPARAVSCRGLRTMASPQH